MSNLILDLPQRLKDAALSEGWETLLYFGAQKEDAEADLFQKVTDLDPGQRILIYNKRVTPLYESGSTTQADWSFLCCLAGKFDADYTPEAGYQTASNLDETYEEKEERRLAELRNELVGFLSDFACAEDVDLTFGQILDDINVYDLNVDMVVVDIRILEGV